MGSVLKLQEDTSIVEEPQIDFKFHVDISTQISKKDKSNTLNVLSLFSGCGGMDLGFEGGFVVNSSSVNEVLKPEFIDEVVSKNQVKLKKTKFRTVFANDIFIDARNVWLNYFSKRGRTSDLYFTDSIVDLVKMHRAGVSIFPSDIDVVTGGFPCQDFSIAGKRNGFNSHKNHKGELITNFSATTETRGQLYMWMKEVIEITQPKIFIAENVKGLVNLSNVKDIIQKDFSSVGENGYIVLEPQVLHAANYGVPQSRERVFFIGVKKSALKKSALNELQKKQISEKFNPYPEPTHSFTGKGDALKKFVVLNDIFKNIDEPDCSSDLSQKHYSKAKFMGSHCQGQTEIKLDNVGPTIRAEHHGNIEFRRLSKKNGGRYTDELAKGMKERRLTPRECGLIQTFPIDFEFIIENFTGRKGSFLVSPSQAYKVIGNAVPPLLAYNLAMRIQGIWDLYFKK